MSAFKMNSPLHKTSKKPIVTQTRTKADPSLVYAGEELGKSYIPGAIDYAIKIRDFSLSDKKEKEKKRDIDETGADPGSESRSHYNENRTIDLYDLNKEKHRGGEDIQQDWSDPGLAVNDTDSAFSLREQKILKKIYRNATPNSKLQKNTFKKLK